MKVTFFERLAAYIVDMIVVGLILSLIFLGLGNNTSKTEKLMGELDTKLVEQTITPEEYLEEYQELLYDYQKENVLETGVSLALTIAYYVVFQYMNKGQTLGKKLLNIKVVDKTTEKPISILKGLLRSFLIMSILSGILGIIFLYIFNKDTYFMSYSIFLFIEGIFVITSILFMLYKKDGRGLHDMMANTIVVKDKK